jgi:GntR family transcriptional regulator
VPVPDYSDPTPARKQIADDLREQIRAGKYAPGSRLPSNLALSKHYKVAPETVRAALGELGGDGTVVTQSTRGTFVVNKPTADVRPDLQALGEQLAELAERVKDDDDLRARVEQMEARLGRVEADVRYLYDRDGIDYDHEGEHDDAGKSARRGRGRR